MTHPCQSTTLGLRDLGTWNLGKVLLDVWEWLLAIERECVCGGGGDGWLLICITSLLVHFSCLLTFILIFKVRGWWWVGGG